jgi:hypothetical protein
MSEAAAASFTLLNVVRTALHLAAYCCLIFNRLSSSRASHNTLGTQARRTRSGALSRCTNRAYLGRQQPRFIFSALVIHVDALWLAYAQRS